MLTPRWSPAFAGVIVTLLAAAPVQAQVLTIAQATHEVLTHNSALRAGAADVAASDAAVVAARAGWFPRINVDESWQRGNQPGFVFGSLLASRRFAATDFAIDALNRPVALDFHRASVGVEQPVFDPRTGADVERARLGRDAARLTLDDTRAGLAVSTAETYGRLVAAEAARQAVDAALAAARADRRRAADRRDAGMATDADVLALDAHVATLAQRAVQADGDATIARAQLNRLMGAPIERTYQVIIAPPPAPASGAADLQALWAEAEAARPELRRAAVLDQLARSDVRRARAELLPRVLSQAGVEVSGTRFDERASSWLVGAEVRWSLSLGGAERAQLTAAARAREKAAADAAEVRAAARVDVVAAVTRQRSASARLAAGSAAVAQARESERIVRDRFEAGFAGVTDLLRAQGAVLDADANRTAAMVDALVSAATLDRALGRHP